jgi:hypothetical protein
MSLNLKPVLRIVAALAAVLVCAWGVVQYLDYRAFLHRNANAMALCRSLTRGMTVEEAERRARATTATLVANANGRLLVRFAGEGPCLVEIQAGKVQSALVAGYF